MKLVLSFAVLSAFCLVLLAAGPKETSLKPQYDAKGNLVRLRDTAIGSLLSAGYGINYSPPPGSGEMFTKGSFSWALGRREPFEPAPGSPDGMNGVFVGRRIEAVLVA